MTSTQWTADMLESLSNSSTPKSPPKTKIGIDKTLLFSKLQAASPSGKGATIDRRAILAAMRKPKTPSTPAGATGSDFGAASTTMAMARGGAASEAAAEESRRLVRKLQEQLQTKTEQVESLEGELDLMERQASDLKRQQLKDVADLKMQYPKLEEEHSEIFKRLQSSQADALVMLNSNRELKRTCDTFLEGQKETSKLHSELDRLQRDNELLTSRIEEERGKGKLALPDIDEAIAHSPWNSDEIREKTEAMDNAFGALSSFHEMYLSDVSVEHGDASTEEIQQHSLELQMKCVETAAVQLGLLEPKTVAAMKQQNEALRAELDASQVVVVEREREIKVLESKHSDLVTIDRVELAELRANEAALQTELASQRISAAADASRAEMESNELRRASNTSRDSYETLQQKVRSLQGELIKMKALSTKMEAVVQQSSGPDNTFTALESERNAELLQELGEMKKRATDLERTAKFAITQRAPTPVSKGGISQGELERQNVALKSEIRVLRETLGLSTSYPKSSARGSGISLASGLKAISRSHSAGSIGSDSIEEKDGDAEEEAPARDQRVQLLQMRLSGFFSKHDQGMLKAVQEKVQGLKYNSTLRSRPVPQCHLLLGQLLEVMKEQPDFSVRCLSAKDMFDEALTLVRDVEYSEDLDDEQLLKSIDAFLLGFEEYFVDYGFFIGWSEGENVANGQIYPHLAFREGSMDV